MFVSYTRCAMFHQIKEQRNSLNYHFLVCVRANLFIYLFIFEAMCEPTWRVGFGMNDIWLEDLRIQMNGDLALVCASHVRYTRI